MELKGSKDWSEDSDGEKTKSSEADRQPVQAPERKARVFDLGIIYNRQEKDSDPGPVFQERARSEPEVAQGVTPGALPEAAIGVTPVPSPAERAYVQQASALETSATETDEDDDEEDDKEKAEEPVYGPVKAPIRFDVEPAGDAEPILPPPDYRPTPSELEAVERPAADTADQSEPDPESAAEPPPQPVEAEQPPIYYSPPTAETGTPMPPQGPAFAGGNRMPPPPPPTETSAPFVYPEPERWQNAASYASPAPTAQRFNAPSINPNTANMVTRREFDNAQESHRKKMAAAVITSLAIGWYLGHRKVKPLQHEVRTLQKENAEAGERIAVLERQQPMQPAGEQQSYEQQYSAAPPAPQRAEQFQTPPTPQSSVEFAASAPFAHSPLRPPVEVGAFRQPAVAPEMVPQGIPVTQEMKVIGENGQEIVLQPGEHFIQAGEGQYSAVVDKYNRVVYDRINYGESYRQDLQPERMPTPFGSKDARFMAGGASQGGGGGSAPMQAASGPMGGASGGAIPGPMLSSGQVPQGHSLPADSAGHTPKEEAQHLLDVPKSNPVIAAITSPWLWLGVGILMIAFFAAATI